MKLHTSSGSGAGPGAGSGSGSSPRWALAEAPASVANVAVGYDCLGFAVPVASDRVRVLRLDDTDTIRIDAIRSEDPLPDDPERNTAAVALTSLRERLQLTCGFAIEIEKGIPLGSGLGGSAASAVAAVVAAAALIDPPPSPVDLLAAATIGEGAASGAPHADNAAASLLGGCVLVLDHTEADAVPLRVPEEVVCSLVHPHLVVETRTARSILDESVPLPLHAQQSALLAGFVIGCEREDWILLGKTLRDVIIEPQRSRLIPGFDQAQAAGLEAGALGVSIAGAGPTIFAWSRGQATAEKVTAAIAAAIGSQKIPVDTWTTGIDHRGAHVIARGDQRFEANEVS